MEKGKGVNPSFRIRASVLSDRGRVRANNEDNYSLFGTCMAPEQMDSGSFLPAQTAEGELLAAVFDGMGGEARGEWASHFAAESFSRLRLKGGDDARAQMESWARKTSRTIERDGRKHGAAEGTTAVLIRVAGGEAHCAWAGDSRIYCLSGGKLTMLSRDHSETNMLLDAGILTPEEAERYPRSHAITRFLGMEESENAILACGTRPLRGGERFLLCSDGLTDMVPDAELRRILLACPYADEAAKKLAETALENGGRDNVTCLVIDILPSK